MSERRQCDAKSKRSQERCKKSPLLGLTKCAFHAGVSPKANRARFNVERGARSVLTRLGDSRPVGDPLAELQRLAGEALAWKDACAAIVRSLEEIRRSDSTGGEQLRAEVSLYTTAMRDLGNLLVSIGRLDIDGRLVAIHEEQSERLRAVLVIALRKLGLDLSEAMVIEAVQDGIKQTEPKQIGGTR